VTYWNIKKMNRNLGDEVMCKSFSVKKPLKIILDISYYGGIVGIMSLVLFGPCIIENKSIAIANLFTIKGLIFAIIESIVYVMIINELRKIVDRITKKTAFAIENVNGFRKIAKYIIVFGFVDLLDTIITDKFHIFFAFNKGGSMKIDVIIYLILAGTTLVIAEVLEKAIEIKNENDLTI